MTDYTKLVEALRWCDASFLHECDNCLYVKYKHYKDDCMDRMLRDAAAAIEALQAEVKDLNEALKSESKARQNAETKRYCCNCAHMDASMYDEAWYGICKLNDFEVEAIHGWGCTDWAKMEVQDG